MSKYLMNHIPKLTSDLKNERGQGLVEYALILLLIAVVVMGAVQYIGPSLSNNFGTVNTSLTTSP